MTKAEKRAFIRSFCNSVRDDILKQVGDMPEGWDGLELREFVADEIERERILSHPANVRGFRARLRLYKRGRIQVLR